MRIVGREAELGALRAFIEREASSAGGVLVLTGAPGIGKTTLWEAGLGLARAHGHRVLQARAASADAQLSFAALIDLLDGVGGDELAGLPEAQRRALEVALLRAEPEGRSPDAHQIALAFLGVLRLLAAERPLLVAIDDVQWLDAPSVEALLVAARRLEGAGVVFLLSRRALHVSPVERALGRHGRRSLEVGPLHLGGLRRLLRERLSLTLPRHLLRRLDAVTLGNPLFALELGRALQERGLPGIGQELPLPDAIEDLLGTRVAGLPEAQRRLLLAVALSGDLRTGQLATLASATDLRDAVDAGLLTVEGDRARASHPLLAAAATGRARASERRALHRALAAVATGEELRALHLALASEQPDGALAATLAHAAEAASARAARAEAVELGTHALRLTPPDDPARPERILSLAATLSETGQEQRISDLLVPELDRLPPGEPRVRACILLLEGVLSGMDDIERLLQRALLEAGGVPRLRALVLVEMTIMTTAVRLEHVAKAAAFATEALPHARRAGPAGERAALQALTWTRVLRGLAADDLCERFEQASDQAWYLAPAPHRVAAQRLVWRGDLARARAVLTRLLAAADEQAEPLSYALMRLHVVELDLRCGALGPAERRLDEWADVAEQEQLIWPMYPRCRALLAALRGDADEAGRWISETLEKARASGARWDELEGLRAQGLTALLAREPARAVEPLQAVWDHTVANDIDEPGVFPVAPDLVEARVELEDLASARPVVTRLRNLAEQQEHPWALANARRCESLLRLAAGDEPERAAAELASAAETLGELGLPLEQARALLALGKAQRRRKQWSAARRALDEAAAVFDEAGAAGWAALARAEAARVAPRRSGVDDILTPSQRRVVELASEGLSNKEIAQSLVVSVRTVETHLSAAFLKLRVTSRAQLAHRLSGRA